MHRPLSRPLTSSVARAVGEGGVGVYIADASAFRADTAPSALSIATYDGSGQLVHPSVYDAGAAGWNGKRYWMAATPYPGGDASFENPSIYCADSLDGPWAAPDGLTNPIDPNPGGSAINSDTHLVDGRDGYLYCFYREYNSTITGAEERICYRRSSDGVTWGSEVVALTNNQNTRRLVSPAIEWDGAQWVMYAVDILPATNALVRLTASALAGTWSAPTTCTLTMPSGRDIWHLDAKFRYGQWFILAVDNVSGSTSGGSLFLLRSSDGLAFTYPSDYVMPRVGNWHDLCYRACLVPRVEAGRLLFDMIYSGINSVPGYFLGRTVVEPYDVTAYAAEPAAAIAGAAANSSPYLVGDNFNRADGAVGTSTGGEAWVNSTGTLNIASNKAAASAAANTRAYLEAGQANAYVEATLSGHADGSNQSWLVCRLSDGSNFWRIGYIGAAFTIQKIVAGSATTTRTINSFRPGQLGLAATVRLGVRMNGNDWTLFYDGKAFITFADSFNASATKHGVNTNNTATRFDDFFARALVNGE